MPSRIERHAQTESSNRRVLKNQSLYQEMRKYDHYQDVSKIEPLLEKDYDLELAKEQRKTRLETRSEFLDGDFLPSIIDTDEEPERDINRILTEAKKLRQRPDELEAKRKLKKDEYNITSQVDVQKIDEIQKIRNTGVKEEEQGELKELIDTIYSSALKDEIDEKLAESGGDLFDDLMPSREDETLINESFSTEIIEEEIQKRKEKESPKIENSFFTKSMELTNEDMEEEDEELFLDEKKLPVWAILLIVITIVAIVLLAGYFVYKSVL